MPGTIEMPAITWNLILTAVIVPMAHFALKAWLKKLFEARDAKDKQIALLLAEKEEKKEEAIATWRKQYNETLCGIKVTVDGIKDQLNHRIHVDDCIRLRDDCGEKQAEIREAVSDIRDKVYALAMEVGSGKS